jgi:hypothetical protein
MVSTSFVLDLRHLLRQPLGYRSPMSFVDLGATSVAPWAKRCSLFVCSAELGGRRRQRSAFGATKGGSVCYVHLASLGIAWSKGQATDSADLGRRGARYRSLAYRQGRGSFKKDFLCTNLYKKHSASILYA